METYAKLNDSGLESAKKFLRSTLTSIVAQVRQIPELERLLESSFTLDLENYEGFAAGHQGWQPRASLRDCVIVKDEQSVEFFLDLSVAFKFNSPPSSDPKTAEASEFLTTRKLSRLFSDTGLLMDVSKRATLKLSGIANVNYACGNNCTLTFVLVYIPKADEMEYIKV